MKRRVKNALSFYAHRLKAVYIKLRIKIDINADTLKKLFGTLDANIIFIEKELGVKASAHGGCLELSGADSAVTEAEKLVKSLIVLISQGAEPDRTLIRQSIDMLRADKPDEIVGISRDVVAVTSRGRQITCKTLGQRDYVRAIKNNTVVLGIGPAGTGKTYLAVALAWAAYRAGEAERIILTRPALEAGEKLGFLPGDLQMKIDPYLRPLYDALSEMFGPESYLKLMERGVIEAAPLAYMRGRTLSGAFIILDEAQNTTEEQMKMFLTRLGPGSKMIVTGDETQIDLPGKNSGLKQAARILSGLEDVAVCYLTDKDVVRHELVQRIVLAYAKEDSRARERQTESKQAEGKQAEGKTDRTQAN